MKSIDDTFEEIEDLEFPDYVTITPIGKTKLKRMSLLDKLEMLIRIARGSQLDDALFKRHKTLIESVAADLEIKPSEVVMLCPFINESESSLNHREIREFFSCSPITFMRKSQDIKALLRRRYIKKFNSYRGNNSCYQLTEKAKNAFCSNQALPTVNIDNLTAEEFMKHFTILLRDLGRYSLIDQEELNYETMELLRNNQQLSIVRNICSLKASNNDMLHLLYFCKRLIVDHQVSIPLEQMEFLVDDITDDFDELMRTGRHLFIREGLIALSSQDSFFSNDLFQLTDKARALFLDEYEIPANVDEIEEDSHSNIIRCNDILPKSLYYCSEDQGQIDTLQHLLEDEQLQAIRERLEKAHLRKGFNCLFYGAPGTGKTETALQLARATGRDIMQVDISSIRDKWYGETEKIVKSVFENYAQLVQRAPKIPILLINEADALLSVRTGIGGSNPSIDKTENAIQNILLEAMENIDGIMIATTNLTCNLDSAFDRRFLYKVEFHQPSVEAKTHIWRTFLPDLSQSEAQTLARTYDFSGGQIENIARKVMVDQLLFGGNPDLAHIDELCSKEQIAGRSKSSYRPIGFH